MSAPTTPRERFDPPLLRARWTADATRSRDAFLADARARTGFPADRFDSMLRHGGLHLDRRPHGAEDLPAAIAAGTLVDAYAFAHEPEAFELAAAHVLAEGDDWIALDKPAHVTTQASRASRVLSLEAALRRAHGGEAWVAVHRLDRETSGVVLFALGRDAAARFGRAFAEGRAEKRYLALVSPAPREDEWKVSGAIARRLDPQRYRFALLPEAAPGAKWSETQFRVVRRADGAALVECVPVTGRTHQIRVHLASCGAPIVGDALYGGAAAERVMLHAASLVIAELGIEVEAPLSSGFALAQPVRRNPSIARSARIEASE